MTIWLDNHLSPALARWIAAQFGEPCVQVRDLGLAELVSRIGPPPAIILLSCGNTSTAYLRSMLRDQWAQALEFIRAGEPLVEIGGQP